MQQQRRSKILHLPTDISLWPSPNRTMSVMASNRSSGRRISSIDSLEKCSTWCYSFMLTDALCAARALKAKELEEICRDDQA
jgi:hypothetical protein